MMTTMVTMMVISMMMKTMTNPYFELRNDGSVHEFTPGLKDFNLKLLSDDIYKRINSKLVSMVTIKEYWPESPKDIKQAWRMRDLSSFAIGLNRCERTYGTDYGKCIQFLKGAQPTVQHLMFVYE